MTSATHAFRLLSRQREWDIDETVCHLVPTTRHIFWHLTVFVSCPSLSSPPCHVLWDNYVEWGVGVGEMVHVGGAMGATIYLLKWRTHSCHISRPFHLAGGKLLKEPGFAWRGPCEVTVTKGDLWLTLYWPKAVAFTPALPQTP